MFFYIFHFPILHRGKLHVKSQIVRMSKRNCDKPIKSPGLADFVDQRDKDDTSNLQSDYDKRAEKIDFVCFIVFLVLFLLFSPKVFVKWLTLSSVLFYFYFIPDERRELGRELY